MPSLRRSLLVLLLVLAAVIWSVGPVAAGGSDWKVGYYTPSGRALSMASADQPSIGLADFSFTNQPNTALLVTTHGSSDLLGDMTGKTISATYDITGMTPGAQFIYYGEPSCGNTISTVRLFFQTSNAGGFDETHYWWSNPMSNPLTGNAAGALTANVSPAGGWSDFYGHFASDPVYTQAFLNAASSVTVIGLSFGGGCFFENGVGTTDGSGTFTLDTFTASSAS